MFTRTVTILNLLALAAMITAVSACGDTSPTETPPTPTPHLPTVEASVSAVATPTATRDYFAAANVPSTPSPTATPNPDEGIIYRVYVDHRHEGLSVASVEERVYKADVVVQARLLSATDDTLRFRAVRYIKSTGPKEFTVLAETEGRNTQWDNQDAMLFLSTLSGQSTGFEFADTTRWDFITEEHYVTEYRGELPEGYTLGTRNPVWLPVGGGGTAGSTVRSAAGDGGDPDIITEYAPGGSPVMVTQSDLQELVRWTSGPFSAGGDASRAARNATSTGTSYTAEEYSRCIESALADIRRWRDEEVQNGQPYPRWTFPTSIDSGSVAAFVPGGGRSDYISRGYDRWELFDGDEAHFWVRLTDDDTDPRNGYYLHVVPYRPLPQGVYTFNKRWRKHYSEPCQFAHPDIYATFDVEATAPAGTVHEAFFDPATTTAGVGYLAGSATTTGVLEPAGFSMRGRDIDITGLEWRNGQVVLSFDRIVQLSDGLSFIETDGTAGLYLSQYDDTEDLRARTATWDVPERPWEPGDELMLRMGPIPLPAVRNLTAEANSAGEVVLRWEVAYRAGVSGYRIWRHRPGRDEGPRIYVSDTLSTDTTYTDANSLVPNLTEYRVQAIDRVYNAGESSESVRVGSQ